MIVRNLTKTMFIKILPWILRCIYRTRQVRHGSGSDGKVPVLVYHKITDMKKGIDAHWNVPQSLFADQMAYLRSEKFSVLPLADFYRKLLRRKEMPPRPVVVTFDDGYAGVYRHAYPILKRFAFPATVFIAVDYVEKRSLFWWDSMILERLPAHHESLRMLDWSEILEMQSSGLVSFGSHTMTHPHLATIPAEKIEYELAESKAVLEKRLGRPADFFAYPGGIPRYGDLSGQTEQILTRCGYHLACTSVFGRNGYGDNPYRLKRIGIGAADTLPVFRAKVTGACDWMESAQSAFQLVFKNVY